MSLLSHIDDHPGLLDALALMLSIPKKHGTDWETLNLYLPSNIAVSNNVINDIKRSKSTQEAAREYILLLAKKRITKQIFIDSLLIARRSDIVSIFRQV
jgi:hypothetical protein